MAGRLHSVAAVLKVLAAGCSGLPSRLEGSELWAAAVGS